MNNKISQRYRIFVLSGIVIFLFLVLLMRLGYVQLSDNEQYNESIDTQSVRIIRIPATRGQIKSADGIVIADSIPCYNIVFHLAEMRKYGQREKNVNSIFGRAQHLAVLLDRKMEITAEDIVQQMNLRPAMPMTVFSNLTEKELALASEISPPIPGMEISAIPKRYYKHGKSACHIIGYVSKDDPGEAPDKSKYSYYIPDIKGKSGLEKLLDTKIALGNEYNGLRGTAGSKLVRVNVKGYVHDDMGITDMPVNGNNVELTLNWQAQQAAVKTLEGKKGAIVVLDANTGAVIAMASSPVFDSNIFSLGITQKEWEKLITNNSKPLINRALTGEFLPGSIVKPLVALAALRSGISPNSAIYCAAEGAKIGNTQIKCWSWKYGGHGSETMINAIKDSCNVYFVETGLKIGFDKLVDMYKHAGFGRKTGIELSERQGILPSKELKQKIEKAAWTNFDTGLISVGQGMIAITPIQAAVYASAIANGGNIWKPYLIKAVYNSNNKLLFETSPVKTDKLPVTEDELAIVREGMHNAVYDPNGSGKKAKNDAIELYGKTGTAQVGSPEHRTKNTWFIGFGYHNSSAYSIAILVDGGEAGGITNAPMAKTFFETWLGVDTTRLEEVSVPDAVQND